MDIVREGEVGRAPSLVREAPMGVEELEHRVVRQSMPDASFATPHLGRGP
jgi:hypothetical protein